MSDLLFLIRKENEKSSKYSWFFDIFIDNKFGK